LVQYPIEFVNVTPETILTAYDVSVEKNHDVYDCFYLALAREAGADQLVTTDRDFEKLCRDESFTYTNPVPEEILTEFHAE
jgi:predicted nucleic acid-binding protein